MITVYKKSRTFPLLGKTSNPCSFANAVTSAHTAANGSRNPIRSSPATTAGPAGWHFTLSPAPADLFLKTDRKAYGVSVQTVCRLLDTICYPPPDFRLPQALSIDEFKGNASTGKYQCILVDPKSAGSSTFSRIGPKAIWLIIGGNIPRKERLKVKFFVCDMWRPYTEPCTNLLSKRYNHRG